MDYSHVLRPVNPVTVMYLLNQVSHGVEIAISETGVKMLFSFMSLVLYLLVPFEGGRRRKEKKDVRGKKTRIEL